VPRVSRSSVFTAVERLEFGRRHVAAVLLESSVIEPIHPLQRADFHMFDWHVPGERVHLVLEFCCP